jgi:Protein of unknown function (DUF4058)
VPLIDHFHSPGLELCPWESFHSMWISNLVRALNVSLPRRYRALPDVHLGTQVQVDVATVESEQPSPSGTRTTNGVATAVWAPARPTQSFTVDFAARDTFELRVHDAQRSQRIVAALELVSPANKDRPASRRDFAIKCASYLQQRVSLVVVDIVTERRDDLYAELLDLLDLSRGLAWASEPPVYAVACRTTRIGDAWQMETWPETLTVGAPLPRMPLWLADDLAVPLDLEASYEETVRSLRLEI